MRDHTDLKAIRTELRRSVVINAAVPFLVFRTATGAWHLTDLTALVLAACVPAVVSLVRIATGKGVDLVGALALVALAVSAVGAAAGGGTDVVLFRDSFLTGALAIASFASLATRRPLMFHIVKRLRAGDDPAAREAFDELAQQSDVKHRLRLTTAVWAVVYTAEVIVKLAMIATLPTATVLGLSPIVTGGITVATIAWTIRFFQRHANPVIAVA